MGSFLQAKTLGKFGSILVLLGLALGEVGTISAQLDSIPNIGLVIAIAGLVLILTAVKYISELIEDPSVFKNMLNAAVLFIVGIALAGAVFLIEITSRFDTVPSTILMISGFPPIVGFLIGTRAIVGVLVVVGAIFLRASYDVIGTRLGAERFRKTGPLFLIGLGLTILFDFSLGLLILGAAAIMQIAAFFSLPDQISPASPKRTSEPHSLLNSPIPSSPQTLSWKTWESGPETRMKE
jgi:uncharacterized membrane protein